MTHSGDGRPEDPYLEGLEDAAAGKWYSGAYIFNNPARQAVDGDPSLCVETLYRRFRRALENARDEEFTRSMVVLRALNTVFTKVLIQQPHVAVRLLHTTDAAFGLRILSFSHQSEQKRRILPTNRPVGLDAFGPYIDESTRDVVEEFVQMAHRSQLQVQCHTRKEGHILMALGCPVLPECGGFDSIVELVFAKTGYRAFRQLGQRGPEPVKETELPSSPGEKIPV